MTEHTISKLNRPQLWENAGKKFDGEKKVNKITQE
jgi:hypothetical protein